MRRNIGTDITMELAIVVQGSKNTPNQADL